MKIYEIALYLFMFNIAAGMLNYALYSYGMPKFVPMQDTSYIEQALNSTNTTGFSISAYIGQVPIIGDLYTAIRIAVKVIWNSTMGFPSILENVIGVPEFYANLVRVMLLFVYAAGVADYIRGSGGVET